MQLIIKLHSDRPVRIGVLFDSQFKAGKQYQEILESHSGETFKAFFEVGQDGLNLTLKSDQSKGKYEYTGLGYQPDQFKKLAALVKPGHPIEFVHVYGTYDNLYVAKTINRKMEIIKISGFEILVPD